MPPSFPPTAICAMYHFPRKKMWLSAQPSHYQITYLGCQSERSERLKSCFKTFFTIQHCFDGCDPSYEWKLLEMTQWVIMRDIWMVRIMWCKHGRTLNGNPARRTCRTSLSIFFSCIERESSKVLGATSIHQVGTICRTTVISSSCWGEGLLYE